MATFEWICNDCDIYWDRECDVGKAPNRTRCPKCSKLSNRYWGNQNVSISFKDDGTGNRNNPGANDFHTVKRRYKKFAEKGWDKDSANRWLNKSIEKTKETMNDESYRYKPMHINYEALARDGKARKLSDRESREKIERAKKLTEQAYDNANKRGYKDAGSDKLDIAKPQKQQ
jgi:hypothetical protein